MSAPLRLADGGFEAVLFDMDGTLVDTAPDMVGALQSLQRRMGVTPIPYLLGRSNVSNGALGLLKVAFPDMDDAGRDRLMCDFIDLYKVNPCAKSSVFSGLEELLLAFDVANRAWGVVTNKPAHLAEPIMQSLGLADRCACIVSGDTIKYRKPAPEPMLHACKIAGIRPERTIYVGDAARDIQAGQAAGMATVAVAYGYITDDDDPVRWKADAIAANTQELATILAKAVNLDP